MTIKFRKILFLLFIIIFFSVTPLIMIISSGYRIKLSWPLKISQTFQKTGMLIIDTDPENAKIYINEKPNQLFFEKYFSKEKKYITTPAKIKNLLPGEYNIRLEIDGYWLWEKKLTILPGQSTYAEDIKMFKKNVPIQIVEIKNNPEKIFFSEDKKYAIIKNEKIIELDDEKEIFSLENIKKENNVILFSSDNKKVLINNNIFELKNIDRKINLEELIGKKIENIKWDNKNSSNIYYKYGEDFFSFDIESGKNKKIIEKEQFQDYLVKDNFLFYIAQTNNNIKLKNFFLENKNLISEIDLPYSSDYKILNYENSLLEIYDKNHKILYLIDPLSQINPLKEIISGVALMQKVDGKKMIYFNDFEIWTIDLNNNFKKDLLTRISKKITNVFWHSSNNYIIYTTEDTINILELDKREKMILTELIKFDQIFSSTLNREKDILYFGGKIGNKNGLYKLAL